MNSTTKQTEAVTIRHFEPTAADYAAVVAIYNANHPDSQESIADWREEDETRPSRVLFQRLVVESAGQVIGHANYREDPWSQRPGKYWFSLYLLPEFQLQGIELMVYEYIMEVLNQREYAPTVLFTKIREDKTNAHQFLTAVGFEPIMRVAFSRITLATFEAEKHRVKVAAVENSTIKIKTIAELATTQPDWQRRFYALDALLTEDEPSSDAVTFPPFEEFVEEFINRPSFLAEGSFIALDGDEWIGMSRLVRDLNDTSVLHSGFAGVKREYRRRGIATTLKVKALAFAKAYGAVTVDTGNEEHNPMYQLNLQLGFEPMPAAIEYRKVFQSLHSTQGKNHHA